jgi:hypothetical protein
MFNEAIPFALDEPRRQGRSAASNLPAPAGQDH